MSGKVIVDGMVMGEVIRVEVTKARGGRLWYVGLGGQVFDVYDLRGAYILAEDVSLGTETRRLIWSGDCRVVEQGGPQRG